ncbi:hypothetical protein [Pseudomonas sp. zfem002]|nr:hypothetical protein [Pseudomonas sp. zfem002]MDU9393725.1 hypothetical protein [Pseudomonas sp. zfem002]
MIWTITDTAGVLLLAMAIFSAWCAMRANSIQTRRKKEQGQ